MSSKIIINADDLGLCASVNEGIFEAMDAGIVTDASLMANGEGFAHAVRGLVARGRRAVGLHFCIVDRETPLTTHPAMALLTEEGHFFINRNRLFLRFIRMRNVVRRAIEEELNAQIRKILDTGLAISHFDSHQHLHLFPGIAEICARACGKFKIPFMRIPATRMRSPIALAVEGLSRRSRRLARSHGVQGVSSLGFEMSGRVTREGFAHALRRGMRLSLSELMVHPGHAGGETARKYSHWGFDWDRELRAVFAAKDDMRKLGVEGVSYESLLTP